MADEDPWFEIPRTIVTGLSFVALWIYAVMTYGWFLGGGLGWIPAFFIAIIVGYLWPLALLAGIALLVQLANAGKFRHITEDDIPTWVTVPAILILSLGCVLVLDNFRERRKNRKNRRG